MRRQGHVVDAGLVRDGARLLVWHQVAKSLVLGVAFSGNGKRICVNPLPLFDSALVTVLVHPLQPGVETPLLAALSDRHRLERSMLVLDLDNLARSDLFLREPVVDIVWAWRLALTPLPLLFLSFDDELVDG